eukprot:COSAG01_NODE_7409_length_3218_cov_8.315948_1_plen_110_part_00
MSWVARSMIDFSSENLQTMPAIRFGIASMAISLSILCMSHCPPGIVMRTQIDATVSAFCSISQCAGFMSIIFSSVSVCSVADLVSVNCVDFDFKIARRSDGTCICHQFG